MIFSGLIHIHLWDIAYRHVATLGPLFLVQAIAALVLAVVLVVARVVVVALACIALMLGTVVGFILADTVGIFGFTLPAVTGWAYEALDHRAGERRGARGSGACGRGGQRVGPMRAAGRAQRWPRDRPAAQAPVQRRAARRLGRGDADHGRVEVTATH